MIIIGNRKKWGPCEKSQVQKICYIAKREERRLRELEKPKQRYITIEKKQREENLCPMLLKVIAPIVEVSAIHCTRQS